MEQTKNEPKNENKAAPDNGKPKKERKPLTEGRNMTMIVAPRDAATAAKSARQQPKQEAAPAQ